jgi:hypothetical protein
MKSFLFLLYSNYVVWREYAYHAKAEEIQRDFLLPIIRKNRSSSYGTSAGFSEIRTLQDFKNRIPLVHYEDILPYIERIKNGEDKILTNSRIQYLLLTSGTSAGTKYIPISKSGISHQINAALKLLCFYAVDKGNAKFIEGKMLFLQGSPRLDYSLNIPTGRLSGVVYHHVPTFFQQNKLPSYELNIIENWQNKINQIANECSREDITVFGGIPPWCLQFFELISKKNAARNLKAIFPNLGLYIYGGVDFSSYHTSLQNVLSDQVDMMQTFPASEGFFAIQDKIGRDDMLLLISQGIFYEFIPFDELAKTNPCTLQLNEVELAKNYELVITNDSGLWRYRMGDLVQFTSIQPYRIQVTGRTSQFISAFGEHVIGYEVERVMSSTIAKFSLKIEDYHVSPNVEKKCYEWRIEWREIPSNIKEVEKSLDCSLCEMNKYYRDLIEGEILKPCVIISISTGIFAKIRKQMNKEGGQNKVMRLTNSKTFGKSIDSLNI